jgi:Lrp/AsnC family transcriptional regulator for asnA, asnC and gidA
MSTGSFQILAEVLCRDSAELIATLETRVRRVPGVVAYESFPYLRLYYQQPEWDAARQKRRDEGLRGGPLPTVDDLDRRILVELNADGRAPLGQISTVVGASESLVRQRINRLVDSGAMKVMALTNPLSLGFGLIAWLGIVAAPGVKLGDLADQLAERGSITYLAICAGRFDIFAELICSGEQELLARLDEEIRPLEGVDRVEVWLCSDLHYKRLQPRF